MMPFYPKISTKMDLCGRILLVLVGVAVLTADAAVRQSLGGEWTVSGSSTGPNSDTDINEKATVPGGIYSDLMAAGIIEDIFFGTGDEDYKWVGTSNWTYSTTFTVQDEILSQPKINLVFEGLDTFATIVLNGNEIGSTDNMFRRYIFPLNDSYFQAGDNSIEVRFVSPVLAAAQLAAEQDTVYNVPPDCHPDAYRGECHINQIRKMQASFAWDWGPSFPSMGIWKDVYLEGYESAVVRYVLATPRKVNESWWTLDVTTSVQGQDSISGGAQVVVKFEEEVVCESEIVNIEKAERGLNLILEITTVMNIAAEKIKLWWPNGYGDQVLYKIDAYFVGENDTDQKTTNFGFRTVELAEEVLDGGLSFYFKINDIPIFAKGSNEIPVDILPERSQNPATIRRILTTARDSNMNMLRVWGGGLYESDYFYETADEFGILIWQDLMYACALYPTRDDFLDSVAKEITHQIKRLQSHPSIVLWSANNENEEALVNNKYGSDSNFELYKSDYLKLYQDTIQSVVFDIVPDAAFVLSSPSNGNETESEGGVAQNPQDNNYGDIHFYDYSSDSWDPATFPIPRFASEYGYQSMPSLDSWLTATDDVQNLAPTSDFLDSRQHHPDGNQQNVALISQQLALPDASHAHYIEAFVYYSQILQAQSVKTETEFYRSFAGRVSHDNRGNTMGALYWQLNDVWVAPTWSGLDFTGRWKMLQYFAKDFFAPTVITGQRYKDDNSAISVFATTDLVDDLNDLMIVVHVYKWDSLEPAATESSGLSLKHLQTVEIPYDLPPLLSSAGCGDGDEARKNCFLHMHIKNSDMTVDLSPPNYLFLENLRDSNLANANVKISSVVANGNDGKEFEVTVTTDAVALFVWLDSHEIFGRFSKNGFLQVNAEEVVAFSAEAETTVDELTSTLTVTHLRDSLYL